MKTYLCHKTVEAFKIERVAPRRDGGAHLISVSENESVEVSPDFVLKHVPSAGSYFIRYNWPIDQYCSISPARAFEAGYSLEAPAPEPEPEPPPEPELPLGAPDVTVSEEPVTVSEEPAPDVTESL